MKRLGVRAIGVVGARLQRRPRTLLEDTATVSAQQQSKTRFSAGLNQIYAGNDDLHRVRQGIVDVADLPRPSPDRAHDSVRTPAM